MDRQTSKQQVGTGEPTSVNGVEGSYMVAVAREDVKKYLGSSRNRLDLEV